jgi:hypothetical protein
MKINNPVEVHKKYHKKWRKIGHYDNGYFIITRYIEDKNIYSSREFNYSRTLYVKEKHQLRTPAHSPIRIILEKWYIN